MNNKLLENLNPEQKEAVLHTEGPVLVIAGAGSGKTSVLTRRVAYLIYEKRVKPYNIFAVTFTNKAAGEMRERIVDLIGNSPDLWVSTFHSASVKILRREIKHLNFPDNFVIFDTSEQKTLIKECMKELKINDKQISVNTVMNCFGAAKNELITPENYPVRFNHRYLDEITTLYRLYQRKLKQNNALDFDDLIFFMVKLFKKCPEVLEKYQQKFKYILIDEYQDINKAQYQMIKYLADAHRNIFVVGDEDQSIYAFRGADMKIILNFEQDFPRAKIIKLQQNYRSTQSILDASNELVKNNKSRREKKLWTDKCTGDKPYCYEGIDERDEAIFVVDEIKKLKKENGKTLNDFVILYRTNAQSRVFEEVLMADGLPYQIVGGLKFYDRKEIKDILAYMKLMSNPADSLAFKRIINVPTRGIGEKTIEKLEELSMEKEMSIYEVLTDKELLKERKFTPKVLNTLYEFEELVEGFKKSAKDMRLSELIEEIMGKTGYTQMLKDQNNIEAISRLENLEELLKVAQEFEYKTLNATLDDFLAVTSLTSDLDMMSENKESITLMTVHSAKGLEYPVVFITGIEEGIFPHQRSIDTNMEADIEEERRLAYVAVTRAKEKLYLSYAWRRSSYGGESSYNDPSRFLDEMGSLIVRGKEEKDLFGSAPKSTTQGKSSFSFGSKGSSQAKSSFSFGSKGQSQTKGRDSSNSFKYTGAPQSGGTSGQVVTVKKSQIQSMKKAFYSKGDSVKHPEFGQGFVMDVINMGGQTHLKVSFPKVGVRKIEMKDLV